MRAAVLLVVVELAAGCQPMPVPDDMATPADLAPAPADLGARDLFAPNDLARNFGPGTPATTPTVTLPMGGYVYGCVAGDSNCGPYEVNPAKTVGVAQFEIDTHEVTQGQYQACVAAGACMLPATMAPPGGSGAYDPVGTPDLPVGGATKMQADTYCAWAGRRLPTEQEWEAAARGGDTRIYPWGDTTPTCTQADFYGCGRAAIAVGGDTAGTSPVGVVNMAGNAAELTSTANPNVPGGFLAKGGSWNGNAVDLRVSARIAVASATSVVPVDVGFRCAK